MYVNEIDDRYYMRTDMMSPSLPLPSALPRKRTIYYAYLPEVVRSPPTVDIRYRSHDRYNPYYPDYEYNNYEVMRRPEKSSKYDYRTSRPFKAYNDDIKQNSYTVREKRFNHEGFHNDNKMSM